MSDEHHEGGSGGHGGATRLANEDALLNGQAPAIPSQGGGHDNPGQAGPPPTTSLDLKDHPPVFVDAEFRQLRERLFGSETIDSYPVSVSVETQPDIVSKASVEPEELPFETTPSTRDDGAADADPEAQSEPLPSQTDQPGDVLPFVVASSAVSEVVDVVPAAATPAGPDTRGAGPGESPTPATQVRGGPPPTDPVDWTTVSPQYSPQVDEHQSRTRLLALLALVVAIAGVGAWLLFGPNAPRTDTPNTESDNSEAAAAASASSPGMRSDTKVVARTQTVVVHQQVVFEEAVESVTLSVPERSGSGPTGPYDPQAKDLEVLVSEVPVATAKTTLAESDTMTVDFSTPVREFTLDYRATGALYETTPSKPGRGLALINAVTVSSTSELPSTIQVNGYRILNLGCVPPDKLMAHCGTATTQGWEFAGITGENGDILAQVDLPTAAQ